MKSHTPLHICFVSNSAWSIYHYRRGLLNALRERGTKVTIIAPRDEAFQPLLELGCDCFDLSLSARGVNPLSDLRTLISLYRKYRALKPDLIFHYTIKPNIYGSLAARLAGIKSIAVTTGLGYTFTRKNLTTYIAKQLYRLAFRFPREIWFLNPDDLVDFKRAKLLTKPERAHILRSEGINLAQFSLAPLIQEKADFEFILIGRLLWDKGIGEYVEAARQLKARYPQARFTLLGPSNVANPSAISMTDIERWQTEGTIDYLGSTNDVRTYIARADCVVLPSYREGVPRTLLEAAALGRPIIATDVPGCREVVDDGLTGLLCAVKNTADLAAKMEQMLLMNTEQRRIMGEQARAKIEREFDEKKIIHRYLSVLTALNSQYSK